MYAAALTRFAGSMAAVWDTIGPVWPRAILFIGFGKDAPDAHSLRGKRRTRGKTAELPRKDGAPMRVLGDPQLQRQLKALGYLD